MPENGSSWTGLRVILLVLLAAILVGLVLVLNQPAAQAPTQQPAAAEQHDPGPLAPGIRKVDVSGTPLKAWIISSDGQEYLVVSHRNGLSVTPHKRKEGNP